MTPITYRGLNGFFTWQQGFLSSPSSRSWRPREPLSRPGPRARPRSWAATSSPSRWASAAAKPGSAAPSRTGRSRRPSPPRGRTNFCRLGPKFDPTSSETLSPDPLPPIRALTFGLEASADLIIPGTRLTRSALEDGTNFGISRTGLGLVGLGELGGE